MSSFVLIDSNVEVGDMVQEVVSARSQWESLAPSIAATISIVGPTGPIGIDGPELNNQMHTFLNDSLMPIRIPTAPSYDNVFAGDIEDSQNTALYDVLPTTIQWIASTSMSNIGRVELLRLRENEIVPDHIDEGTYYAKRDRFHLCLTGSYRYTVDGVDHVITPGMFYWFDNKKVHSALGIDSESIILIVDALYSENNPQHNT